MDDPRAATHLSRDALIDQIELDDLETPRRCPYVKLDQQLAFRVIDDHVVRPALPGPHIQRRQILQQRTQLRYPVAKDHARTFRPMMRLFVNPGYRYVHRKLHHTQQ